MNWYKSYKCLLSMFLLKQIASNPCGNSQSLSLNITRGLLISESFYVVTLPTRHQCAVLCLHFSLCKSANYDKETCYLHQHNTDTDSFFDVSANSSIYYMDYRDISKILTGACSSHNCSVYDKCVPTSEKTYTCVTVLISAWKCHSWTSVEIAGLATEGFSVAARTKYCEGVEHRVYYGNSPLKPKECGTCFCCKLSFSSGKN